MIVYRSEAGSELDQIVTYILDRFGVGAADSFVAALADAERPIAEYPMAHPSVGGPPAASSSSNSPTNSSTVWKRARSWSMPWLT